MSCPQCGAKDATGCVAEPGHQCYEMLVQDERYQIEGLKFLLAWIRTGLPAMSEPAKRIDEVVPDWRNIVMKEQ
jgi:hypothetical protein